MNELNINPVPGVPVSSHGSGLQNDLEAGVTQHLRAGGRGATATSMIGRTVTREKIISVALVLSMVGVVFFTCGIVCDLANNISGQREEGKSNSSSTSTQGRTSDYGYVCSGFEYFSGSLMYFIMGALIAVHLRCE